MATAGTVTVDFAAETAKFSSELKKVRKDLSSLKSDASSIASGFKTAGAALASFVSVAAISGGIRAVAEATAESEKAVSLLNNALQASGRSVAGASQDFQNFATQMQRFTTFNDEAVIGVEALLLRFRGLSSGTIKQATKDILDLSTALGIDLDSAAKTLGRALEDPVKGMTALQKAGVIFSEAQKDLIKNLVRTGDTAGAQQSILSNLESRYKGAAAAARDSFGGALQGLKNSFDDLLEAKGGVPGATKAINDLAGTLQSEGIRHGFEAMTTALTSIISLSARAAAGLANLGASAGSAIGNHIFGVQPNVVIALQKDLKEAQEKLNFERIISIGIETDEIKVQQQQIETLKQRIELAKQLQPLRDFKQALVPAADSIIDQITTPPPPKAPNADQEFGISQADLENQMNLRKFAHQNYYDNLLAMHTQFTDTLADSVAASSSVELDLLTQKLQAEMQIDFDTTQGLIASQESLLTARLRAASAGIAILQQLGTKSKAFAVAALAVQAAAGVHSVLISGTTAAVAALAPPPIGLGPVLGVPLAASIKAWALAEAIGVGALGVLQVGTALSGGGGGGGAGSGNAPSLGTPRNSVFNDGGGDDREIGATAKSAVQIIVQGSILTGRETADFFFDTIREAVNGRDVVIIDSNSQQAREIRRD